MGVKTPREVIHLQSKILKQTNSASLYPTYVRFPLKKIKIKQKKLSGNSVRDQRLNGVNNLKHGYVLT